MNEMDLLRAGVIVFLIFGTSLLSAQDPAFRRPSVRYTQINTEVARIIFPDGLDSVAQEIASLTLAEAKERPFRAGRPVRKIDILLQDATDIPNGYVGLGPWRSEFYLTPPQNSFDIGSLPWHKLLALHEFRHVQQISATRVGLSKWAYYLLGEEAYSGFVHLAVPNWFTEGDAVVAETALSQQGRGRIPAFTLGYQAMVEDGTYWSYPKARNGSLKDFVPNHYPLGYLLLNYGREQYGQGFWDSIAIDAAAYKGLFYSFSRAMRQRTGLRTKDFYREAMDAYRLRWQSEGMSEPSHRQVVRDEGDNAYQNISYPDFDGDQLYVMVGRFDQIDAICAVNERGELDRIVSPGFQTEPYFSAGGGKLCWTELRKHPRWLREDYSVIVVYDVAEKSKRTVTHEGSYFMPDLSPDGTRILVAYENAQHRQELRVLDASDGHVLSVMPNPDNSIYTFPQWMNAHTAIAAIRRADGSMTIAEIDTDTGKMRERMKPTDAPIGKPATHGNALYYTQTHGSRDMLFRLAEGTEIPELLNFTGSHYQPAVNQDGTHLLFTSFTLSGSKLEEVSLDTLHFDALPRANDLLMQTEVEEIEQGFAGGANSEPFSVKSYPLLAHPVRVHSWSLYGDDPVYGVEVLSENTLNTIRLRGGYSFNRNTNFHGPFAEMTFGLWYPEIVAGYSGTRVQTTRQGERLAWWQHTVNAGLRVPFQTYAGPYVQSGSLATRFNRLVVAGPVPALQFNYLSHTLHLSNQRKAARQHAESRFSQAVSVRFLHAIDTTVASQFQVETDWNFPSPIRNHFFSVDLDLRYEAEDNTLRFGDAFDYAPGYDPVPGERIWKSTLRYQLPLAYPDAGVIGLVYFRRIRAGGFVSYMQADGIDYASAGVELWVDVNVFNVEPVTIGAQYARRIGTHQGGEFRLLLPTGFK